MIKTEVDILENDLLERYPDVLKTLLSDRTTQQNIFWATDNYQDLGAVYQFSSQILPELITGENGYIIMPRVKKDKNLQQKRVKKMAEVFTPSWLCNDQINAVDNSWFGREGVFNERVLSENNLKVTWRVNENKVVFPEGKTWEDYINLIELEITCGEAPYLVSRYDTTTGEFIALNRRIGMLDRKLRVINENVADKHEWLETVKRAYKNVYGYEFQGDSLLLARESLLYTFIDHYFERFGAEPILSDIQDIAYIISWNIWQMDGLRQVVPRSCSSKTIVEGNLFDTTEKIVKCEGCVSYEMKYMRKHNGIYCSIMDWGEIDPNTGKLGLAIKFIDLFETK